MLADCYTYNKHLDWNREWLCMETRFEQISRDLVANRPDLMMLCEVDHFDSTYKYLLQEMGLHHSKVQRRDDDFVLVAYDPKVFRLETSWGL